MDASLALTAVAAGLIFACIRYHIKAFSYWSSRGIPGPRPWPILGTSGYYLFRTKIEVDEEWSRKYGKIYGIYEGYIPTLRVYDNEIIKHIFIKNANSFIDRNTNFIKGENMTKWLFFSKGDHWNNRRLLISPIFSSSKLKPMYQATATCTENFIKEIENSTNGKQINEKSRQIFKKDLMFMTLDVISKAFFGLNLNTYKNRTSEFCKTAFAFASFDVAYSMFYMALPTFVREFFKLDLLRPYKYAYFDKLSQQIIDKRRSSTPLKQTDERKQQVDFVQALIDARIAEKESESVYNKEDDIDATYHDQMSYTDMERMHQENAREKEIKFRKFNDLEIRAQMNFLFLAGFETTSNTLGFCLFELANRVNLQEQIYQEVCNLETPLKYEDVSSLKMFNAFISEVMRLYNPVTDTNRIVTAKEGVMLATSPPLYMPYESVISVNGFTYQRLAEYWPEPLKFDITRFYPENKDQIKSCTYMPFGLGPRYCAGMRFALMTLKTTLSRIMLSYQVLPGPDNKYPPDFKQHGFFAQLCTESFLFKHR